MHTCMHGMHCIARGWMACVRRCSHAASGSSTQPCCAVAPRRQAQCHAPMALMEAKGLTFEPSTGEAASSHASNATSGGSSGTAKSRVLAAFADFPPAVMDVVASTPDEAITEHGVYQRTPEQIPDQWCVCRALLGSRAARHAAVHRS